MTERWLITGVSGQLGGHLLTQLAQQIPASDILALAGQGPTPLAAAAIARIDLADLAALPKVVDNFRPTHVIHAAAVTSIAAAFADPDRARRINVDATVGLAEAAAAHHARFVFVSTDMVFDGAHAPYRESDPPQPLSHYGRTKAEAERAVIPIDGTLSVRIPLMYGYPCAPRETTFVKQMHALRTGEPLRLFIDEYRTPLWLGDAARILIALARSPLTGLIHVGGPERLSRYEMAERFADALDLPAARLVPVSRLSIESPEPRPADLSLNADRLAGLFPQLVFGPIRPEALCDPLSRG